LRAASVAVAVVSVRHVGMGVPLCLMRMAMAMYALSVFFMEVIVMAVVMRMSMLVLHWLVHMLMAMGFSKMQHDARKHQRPTCQHHPTHGVVAERSGNARANK